MCGWECDLYNDNHWSRWGFWIFVRWWWWWIWIYVYIYFALASVLMKMMPMIMKSIMMVMVMKMIMIIMIDHDYYDAKDEYVHWLSISAVNEAWPDTAHRPASVLPATITNYDGTMNIMMAVFTFRAIIMMAVVIIKVITMMRPSIMMAPQISWWQ